MSTIKSSAEHLTLNADGASKDIKFQANGVEKASISSAGAFTSTTIDATALTGDLPAISGANLTGVGVAGISSSADATAITIDSSEQVGIGITTPSEKLHLYKTSSAGAGLVNLIKVQTDTNNTTGDGSAIAFHGKYGSTEWGFGKIGGANSGANYGGALEFHTNAGNGSGASVAYTKQLTVTHDGRGVSEFTAKAWVNFNGEASPISINDSHNVSSITDDGVGKYTVNFSNNLGNTNYAVAAQTEDGGGYNDPRITNHENSQARSTSAYGLYHWHINSAGLDDATKMNVIVFGD